MCEDCKEFFGGGLAEGSYRDKNEPFPFDFGLSGLGSQGCLCMLYCVVKRLHA